MSDRTDPVPSSRRAARAARERAAATAAIPVGEATGRESETSSAPAAAAPGAAYPAAPVRAVPSPAVQDVPQAAGSIPAPATAADAAASARTAAPPAAAAVGVLDDPSLDDLFAGRVGTDALGTVPAVPSKRRKRRGRWIALGVVAAILAGIAGGGWYVWSTYEGQIRAFMGWEEPKDYAPGLAHGEALVTVVSGDNGQTISRSLAAAGVTKTPDAFYAMLLSDHKSPTFYPGVYRLQKQMTASAALKALQDPASKLEDSVLLREGLTEQQTLKLVADALKMPFADLQSAAADPAAFGVPAKSLEGWLFPAMYTFQPGDSAHDVIKAMVDRTVQSLEKAKVPVADRQRILTIASIIQREARFTQDFYKVSRVIENRLDPSNQETFGKLQMDSTAQYGYGEMHDGTASSSEAALTDDNPWNTYVHTGLPVGPIANPGDLAIDAAMHPADGPWLYFVTVNMDTGQTVFTTTYAEHEKAVAQMQAWCKANPDSGC